MNKFLKRITAITLCIMLLASTIIIGTAADSDTSKSSVKPDDAPASELLSETKVFTFDNVREYAVNKDYGIDEEGNVFYPVHSNSAKTSVKQKNFEVNGETVTTAEVSAGGKTVFIPTDENGQPFIIEPNTKYSVKIKFYTMAATGHGQFFMGGGTLASNEQACKTSAMDKNFYLWEEGKNKYTHTTGWNPFYRCTGIGWASNPRYFPEVKFETQTNTFRTLDFATEGGMFEESTYKNTGTSDAPVYVSNEEYYDFGKYFGIFFSAGNVNVDGYNGNATYYIDEIEITANRSRTFEVGESYTFNFNEGEVVDTSASTKLTDGDGNTFYPYHSQQTGDSFTQANIDVTLKDGTVQTKSTLRYETKGSGYRQYIPTDKNGKPFVFDPNSKYELIVEGYIEKAGGHSQVFFGGGAFHSDQSSYSPLDNTYNGTNSWYFIDGTDAAKDSGAMVSGYPIYRASSFFWDDIARSFTGFTQKNGDPAQYSKFTMNFTTKDFEEIGTTNHFKADLWQRNKFKVTEGTTTTYPDPYTTEGVEIKSESIGQYFSITCGSSDSIFYIDYITITKVSTTDTADVTLDANGGTFEEGTTLDASLTVGGDFASATLPTNADTTLSFAGWSTHSEGDPVSKVTSAMDGKTLYAIWKPAVANVTFDANGGTLADGSATKTTTQYKDLKFTEANPTRAGYIFKGWALSKDATTPVTVTTADMAGKTLYALWKADPISVTFNANGGKFADGTITKIATQVTGIAPSFEAPIRSIDKFVGWSLSADSSTVVSTITKEMAGTTLYAVYEESHPANGVYDSWSRTVEFDEYKVVADVNTFRPVGDAYGENSGKLYFTVIDDPDQPGDKLLHFYNHSKASSWYANWCITPTYNGVSGTTPGQEDYNILPTDTTFKISFRVRINNTDDLPAVFAIYYGTDNGRNSVSDQKKTAGYTELIKNITKTNGFVEMETYFTTPEEYTITEKGVANRLYLGFSQQQTNLNYDLDWLKIEKVTSVNLYAKVDGKTTLMETLIGQPGSAMNLPEIYSAETYDLYSPVGTVTNKEYGNWFNDEACTEEANLKFGNFNYNLYCNDFRDLPSVSTENQEILVGFDTYTQRTNGLYNAEIVKFGANTGKAALKATVAGKAGFELKNDMVLDLVEGKTYRVDFVYKADSDIDFTVGYSNGLVTNGVNALATKKLAAADDWTAASVVFTANGITDASVLAAKVTAEDATAYFDTMIVSSITESVGVEAETTEEGEALRFMLSYSGSDADTVVMADKEFTVTEHGVLVKAEEVKTELSLENKDAAGVFAFAQTDLSKNWSVNPVTGDTVYSAYLNGFDKNDDYKVSVRGYVRLTDGTVFYTDTITASVNDLPDVAGELIPDNATLSDYYVYLPEGTVFPADKDYTVTTYNQVFLANNAVSNNVLTEGSYVIFSAKPDFAKISVPSELKYMVHAGTKAELYRGVEAQIVSEKISSVGKDSVNYIFITDIHMGSSKTDAQGMATINQTSLIAKMANENDDIDFVVVGGDTTTGMYGTKAQCVTWTQAALDPLLECEKPVFVLMGNHDDNSYHIAAGNKELYANRVITDLDWQNNIINRYTNKDGVQVVQDDPAKRDNSKYYYYDLEGKKTRVIALDALDYEAKYDENGFVLEDLNGDGLYDGMPIKDAKGTTDTARYYNGYTYWGYSADQIRWLAEDALGDLPADYDVVFISHMGMDKKTNSYGSKIWFGENIREILKTFNAGGTYTASLTDIWGNPVSVNANFGDKNGKIMSWQFGHQHVECSFYEADVDLWQICTSSAIANQVGNQTYEALSTSSINNKSLPWRVFTRKLGTETEGCFNVMSVSTDRIYRLVVGQGSNEKMVYPN